MRAKPRETPSSGAYCEKLACAPIQPSVETPFCAYRKRTGGLTWKSVMPPRGSPIRSPTTSTPFPVTTQFDPGIGAESAVRSAEVGRERRARARCRRGSRPCRSSSSRTRAGRSGCASLICWPRYIAGSPPVARSTQSTGLRRASVQSLCEQVQAARRVDLGRERPRGHRTRGHDGDHETGCARPEQRARRENRDRHERHDDERALDVVGVPREVPVRQGADGQARSLEVRVLVEPELGVQDERKRDDEAHGRARARSRSVVRAQPPSPRARRGRDRSRCVRRSGSRRPSRGTRP